MSIQNIKLIFESTRPKQWPKNLLLFAGLIFSQSMLDTALTLKVIAAFFVFCLLSGGTYLINDITDKKFDAQNPLKNKRPIASGRLQTGSARAAGITLLIFSVTAAFVLDIPFGIVAATYLLTQWLYSFWLKRMIIIDVFTVVFSHLLRVIAGTVLVRVEISSWLLLCTILLALFLVICKRRHELLYADNRSCQKLASEQYSLTLLDQMVSIVTSATLISYCLYTISETTILRTGTTNLRLTIPFVLYGIFRYLYLVYQKTEGCPEEILLKDKPLLTAIGIWIAMVIFFLYY